MKDSKYEWNKDALRHVFSKTRVWVVALILLAEFAERLSYYTMNATWSPLLTREFGFDVASKASIKGAFVQIQYISPLVAGIMADNYFGNFRVGVFTLIMYFIGKVMVTVAVYPSIMSQSLFMAGAFGFITVGCGLKAVMMNYGADQIQQRNDETDAQFEAKRLKFFSYWYAAMEVGSFIALVFLSTIATSGAPSLGIPIDYGFFAVYIIAAFCLFVALLAFQVTRCGAVPDSRVPVRKLMMQEHSAIGTENRSGKPENTLREICASVWFERKTNRGILAIIMWVSLISSFVWSITTNIVGTHLGEWASWLVLALFTLSLILLMIVYTSVAWIENTRVARLFKILPLSFIMYATLMISKYIDSASAACQSDLRIYGASSSFQVNGSFFSAAQQISCLIVTFVLNLVVIPMYSRKGVTLRASWRIYFAGTVFALAATSAVVLEHLRKRSPFVDPPVLSKCSMDKTAVMHDFSAWWFVLPPFFIGLGQVLLFSTIAEHIYAVTPANMTSTAIGIWQMSIGIMPAVLHGGVALVTRSWVDQIPKGNLDYNHIEYVWLVYLAIILLGICYIPFSSIDSDIENSMKSGRDHHSDEEESNEGFCEVKAGDVRIA